MSCLGGISSEAPDYPQFLKVPCEGQVNATVDGKVADPLLLDLARLGKDDEVLSFLYRGI